MIANRGASEETGKFTAPGAAGCPRYPSLATGARGGFEGSRVGESAVYWVVASCCVRLPSLRPCNAATPELGLEMLHVRAPLQSVCPKADSWSGVIPRYIGAVAGSGGLARRNPVGCPCVVG